MKFIFAILAACLFATAYSKAIEVKVTQADPRILSMITDFYNNIIAAPINVLAQSLAGMAVHLFAGIAENGIGKRATERDIFDFFTNLGNQLLTAVTPAVDSLVQNVALSLTQALVNLSQTGIGKRATERDFFDFFTNLGNQLLTAVTPAVDSLVQNVALSLTQALVNLSQTGIGKRATERDFFDFLSGLGNQLLNAVTPAVDSLVQNVALSLTQALVNLSQTGIGKRATERDFFDFFTNLGNQLLTAVTPAVDSLVQNVALSLTQALVNLSQTGIGKRATERDFFDFFTNLGNQLLTAVTPAVDSLVQNVALSLTQALVNLSQTGIGKRATERDFFDFLSGLGNQLLTAVTPAVDSLVQTLSLTQALVNLSQTGIGKRATERDFFDFFTNLGNQLLTAVTPAVDSLVQNVALSLTQALVNLSQTGIGKRATERDLFDFLSGLGNQLLNAVTPAVDSLVQNVALSLTQALVNLSQTGIGKRATERDFFDFLSGLGNQLLTAVTPAVDSLVQNVALSLTQALVNLSQTGIGKRDTAEIQRKIFEGLTNWFSQAIQNLSWQITTGLLNVAENGLLPTVG